MKIYTKTGDNGTTALAAGGRVAKSHPRVEAYGTVDEVNSAIGMARALGATQDEWLERVQNDLFDLGADLSTPLESNMKNPVRIKEAAITWLEERIDEMSESVPPLRRFILPGGCPPAAQLHIARTVCRRAERLTVSLGKQEPVNEHAAVYLNRLSDFLFMLARYENQQAEVPETEWHVKR